MILLRYAFKNDNNDFDSDFIEFQLRNIVIKQFNAHSTERPVSLIDILCTIFRSTSQNLGYFLHPSQMHSLSASMTNVCRFLQASTYTFLGLSTFQHQEQVYGQNYHVQD